MDSLRWVLLGIGALLISGIYLLDLFRTKNTPKRRSEVIFNQDSSADFHLNPNVGADSESNADYVDALEDLNKIRTTLDEDENFLVQESDIPSNLTEEQENTGRNEQDSALKDDFIFLRIVAKEGHEFRGLKILIATKTTEMKFGNMNIFHHHGSGANYSDKPIFSLANMYEPGEFNLQEMESFSTEGLVVYMSLPSPLGADESLELMLKTSQRIAEQLEGELRDASNHVLDEEKIHALRDKVHRFET